MRICMRCGQRIHRGEDWIEAAGMRFHWRCVLEAAKKNKERGAAIAAAEGPGEGKK